MENTNFNSKRKITSDSTTKAKMPSLEKDLINHREFISDAKNAIWLKLIRNSKDFDNDQIAFHPRFTHQLFDKDKIKGYKGLRINIYFSESSLLAFLEINYSSICEDVLYRDDIKGKIMQYLKGKCYDSKKEFLKAINEEQRFTPSGKLIAKYKRISSLSNPPLCYKNPSSNENVVFEIWKSSFKTPGFRALHDRMQFFLIFFIDASSFIDPTDSIWTILYLFEKRTLKDAEKRKEHYCFVGYCTLYSFFCFPNSNRLRISQILILPPFQRAGHGGQFMETIYKIAKEKNFAELNIEDPSDGFQFLRDLTDLSLCQNHNYFDFLNSKSPGALSKELRERIKKEIKITDTQIDRCFEVFKLKHLDMSNEEQYRNYRLEVKKRIYKIFNEELGCLNDAERKAKLSELYFDVEKRYSALLIKLLKPPSHLFEILM